MDPMNTTDFKIKRRTSIATIKKLIDEKSQTTNDETGRDTISRLKSNEDVMRNVGRRRPQRPMTGKKKQTPQDESKDSQLTQPINSIPVKQYIEQLLNDSSKINEYLQKEQMSQYQASCRLTDSIFVLSLDQFIIRNCIDINQAQGTKKVQRFIINKLEQETAYTRQLKTCDSIEQKINKMIEQRLKKLKQF